MLLTSLAVGRIYVQEHVLLGTMADIRDSEPPLEGQKGYKGPAIIARFFRSHVKRQADDENQ